MNKKRILPVLLSFVILWAAAVSAAAATRYSDGVYTFEKVNKNTAVIVDCDLTEEKIEVPEFVLGYPVVGIGGYAFMNHSYVSEISLPISLYSIGEYAFAENKELIAVTVPRYCATIADNAFFNSPNVTIYCYTDTPAHQFAVQSGIPYVLLDASNPKTDISNASVSLEATEIPYNGEDHCPEVTVTLGDTELDLETDYTVEYTDNIEVGEATVTVIGIGDYTGRAYASFFICRILGDTDSDGTVTIVDSTFIQRHIASIPIPFVLNEAVADTDEDDLVSIMDATYIQRWLAQLKTNDNIGKIMLDR